MRLRSMSRAIFEGSMVRTGACTILCVHCEIKRKYSKSSEFGLTMFYFNYAANAEKNPQARALSSRKLELSFLLFFFSR